MSARGLGWLAAGGLGALLTAALAWGLVHPAGPAAGAVGQPAPEIALERLDGGGVVRLAELRGRPVVLNFWASWCTSCAAEAPVLAEAARRLEGRVVFLGVDVQDTPEAARAWQAKEQLPYLVGPPVGGLPAGFAVTGLPQTYFIDARGVVVASYSGPLTSGLLDRYLQLLGV